MDAFEIVEKLSEELALKEDKIMALEKLVRELAQKEHQTVRERWRIPEGERVAADGGNFKDELERMVIRFKGIPSRGPRWWLDEWAEVDYGGYDDSDSEEDSEEEMTLEEMMGQMSEED